LPREDGSYHGYGIQHFLKVDPRFASDKSDPDSELRRLVDEAHARGMHVIMDIVLNHAGDVFAYVLDDGSEASSAVWRDSGYPIRWRGADNRPVADWSEAPQSGDPRLGPAAAIWPDEIRSNLAFRRKGRGGEDGGDFESLKEFVSARREVRSALIRSYQHAIAKWDIDGFRIDTLKYIEPDFALVFGNAIREFALDIGKENFFTFGEVYDDEFKIAKFIGRRTDDDGDMVGVDAALDFPLFFRLPGVAKGLSPPTELAAVYALRKGVEHGVISSHGEAGRFFVTFLDNHDSTIVSALSMPGIRAATTARSRRRSPACSRYRAFPAFITGPSRASRETGPRIRRFAKRCGAAPMPLTKATPFMWFCAISRRSAPKTRRCVTAGSIFARCQATAGPSARRRLRPVCSPFRAS
jgi:glycosidase